jgi:hypothetical protein
MKANHRGRMRTYVAVRPKIINQVFPSGPPNVAALVQAANILAQPFPDNPNDASLDGRADPTPRDCLPAPASRQSALAIGQARVTFATAQQAAIRYRRARPDRSLLCPPPIPASMIA